ncbi:lipopolysaccharide core biosynthesis protein rfaS [Capnocytophaga canimorsus]|uniref:lipopolysaccharide core biosynthesis protein rfaS n=1 Tax=Capnocytophaga canimorsus TaxID=28188 RepID=UPI0037CFC90F
MKKKALFIAPDYYGFNDVVFDGLKKYSDYEMLHIKSTGKYYYKNLLERAHNFFLKNFCGKNLKKIRQEQKIKTTILENNYDFLIIIGAYVLSEEILNIALNKSKFSVTIFWDSIAKIPMQEKYLPLFDVCYSFDKDDCQKYGLKEITNFYFVEERSENNVYDISYLATYDNRMEEAISIFNYFQENNIKAKAKIFTYPSHPIKELLPKNFEVIHKIIPFGESYQYYLDSKIILDIAHPHQKGLSFRPFEAMGMNKKLITTNKDIINYDFYDPNNIFVIENPFDFSIPETFFKTDYQEINNKIKEKYHIKNWVKKIFSDYEH